MRIGACHKFASNTLPALVLIGLAHGAPSAERPNTQSTTPIQHRFKFERYDARGGALFKSSGADSDRSDSVKTIFIDSTQRVWVGTHTGLAVYDGNNWQGRTFQTKIDSAAFRALAAKLNIRDCGPYRIAEGPPGTVWFGGRFGVWRYHDGKYEEIAPTDFGWISGLVVDHSGAPWVVTTYAVQRYDGQTWKTVLFPYRTNSIHRELTGLRNIAVATNGHVWIGATVYLEPKGPWTHEGATWVADQSRVPSTPPLFEFDGKNWKAYGPPHGLRFIKYDCPFPELNELGRIQVKTSDGIYVLEGDTWQTITKPAFKRWVLRKRQRGGSELLYRDDQNLVEVRAADHRTGKVLALQSEQLALLEFAEDQGRGCVWLGTVHGLYRIWREEDNR